MKTIFKSVNLNGLVYAPSGTVDITAQNLNLNNVTIIANKISLKCPNVNANNNNFDAFAKCFAEREYLGYLNQGKWFIYKTDNSKNNAQNNIEILNNIISKYAGSDISIDKQLAV